MKIPLHFLLVVALATVVAACGGESADEERGQFNIDKDINLSGEKAEEMVRNLEEAVSQLGKKVDVVSARDLKAVMPERLDGMTRTAYSANKKGLEGFSFSASTATFEEDDGRGVLELSVTDIGNIQGFAQFGLDMLDMEIDEENQDGFQRTVDYKGHKSYQRMSKVRSGSESEMVVFVDGRIIVRAGGVNIAWDQVEEAVDAISVRKLESLIK
ncbi:MAG: hypothetical protein AAF465_10330 [Pseudomonadota bacterium]